VTDRGYQDYALFRQIIDACSSFVGRVEDNIAYVVQAERELTPAARAAGVIRDVVLSRLGSSHRKDELQQPLRLVADHRPAGTGRRPYRYRWTVELFFRWMKSILGMRHLISDHPHGVTMQLYAALIASLLIVLWTGLKANKRTWEMLQFYFMGWATLAELERHIEQQQARQERQSAKKNQSAKKK
jgi:IS4 transposase